MTYAIGNIPYNICVYIGFKFFENIEIYKNSFMIQILQKLHKKTS